MSNLTSSQARQGECVTTHLKYNGTGIGYLVDGQVWEPSGSYWARKAEDAPVPMVSFDRDGGAGYLARARRMLGGR